MPSSEVPGASSNAAKLLLGAKKTFFDPRKQKVNAHVAHRGFYGPLGIVNKVKAPERKLIRGYNVAHVQKQYCTNRRRCQGLFTC